MALAKARNTIRMADDGTSGPSPQSFPVNSGATLYQGGIGALDAQGNAIAGVTGTGLRVAGRIEKTVANSGADGAEVVDIRPGVFAFANSAGDDEITKADVGRRCFLVDDETVAKTDGSTTRSAAGVVRQVDTYGVWVEMSLAIASFAEVSPEVFTKTVTVDFDNAAFLAESDDGDSVNVNVGTALPAGAVLLGARYEILTPFVGAGLATLTMMVGFDTDTNGAIEAVDILGDAAAVYDGVEGTAIGGPAGGKQLLANFDPDNAAGLDELTAGSVKITVLYTVSA